MKRKNKIILDLNGDGTRTTTLANGTYFDIKGDGLAESTAWVNKDDGILVSDLNSNGIIDGGTELVTDLSTYDTNGDGVINASDTAYSNLKVLKGDGTLESLSDAGVASISLVTNPITKTDVNGNIEKYWGTYTTTSGITRKYGDFDLTSDPLDSIETTTVTVSDEIEALPDITSYGTVHALHQAMALDKAIYMNKYESRKRA